MAIELNIIKELYKGHFFTILDFTNPNILSLILDKSYRYVWVIDHNEGRSSWEQYNHLLFGQKLNSTNVIARNIKMEFIMPTNEFYAFIPFINQTLKLIQINRYPPHFLSQEGLSGKSKYDLFKNEVDYLFEIEIPGASDFAQIISPDATFLEWVIDQNKSKKTFV